MKTKVQKLDAAKFAATSKIDVNKTKVTGGAGKKRDSALWIDVFEDDIM